MNKLEAHMMEIIIYYLPELIRQIEKTGVEEFRRELNVRYKRGIHINLSPKELDEASSQIKQAVFDTVTTMAAMVLHDEFGFGQKRLERFIRRFTLKSECLMGGFVTWQDYLDIIRQETGLDLKIRINE